MRAEPRCQDPPDAIRPMAPSDVSAVTKILQQSPEAANWSEQRLSVASTSPGIALVSEREGSLAGFLFARQIGDEAEILNVGVLPSERRCGVGSALLREALNQLRRRGASRVFLEVRESNRKAIAFYNKHGFSETGRRKAYYHKPEEAALLMEKQLNQKG